VSGGDCGCDGGVRFDGPSVCLDLDCSRP
jgi:hypothetical protein